MAWFTSDQSSYRHVLWTKTEYIRNLAALPFRRADSDGERELIKQADALLVGNGFRKEEPIGERRLHLQALAEKQLIDASECDDGFIYFNEPCNLSVMLGGKNFITIRSVTCSPSIAESLSLASGAEEMLDKEFPFSYDPKFGYLAPDIRDAGSCSSFSAALFLPAMARLGEVERILGQLGANVTPMYSNRENSGNVFGLSFKPSLEISEGDAALFFDKLLNQLTQHEKALERIAYGDELSLVTDKAWRALGILTHAREMGEDELLNLISDIRLAALLCPNDAPHQLTAAILDELSVECLNSTVAQSFNKECLSITDCNRLRCQRLRDIISSHQTNHDKITGGLNG